MFSPNLGCVYASIREVNLRMFTSNRGGVYMNIKHQKRRLYGCIDSIQAYATLTSQSKFQGSDFAVPDFPVLISY